MTANMEPLKLGIVGFGLFAERRLVPGCLRTNSVEIVAIQKRSLEAAKEKAELYHIPRYYDQVGDLLSDDEVEAVFIASPNNLHAPQTIAAARAGKHIVVEKPMALNAGECREMIRACEDNGVKLMVAHCQRFLEGIREIREIVETGVLGEVHFAEMNYSFWADRSKRTWFRDKAVAGGGALFDVGVHCYDTLRFVLGDEARSVYTQTIPEGLDLTREVADHLQCSFRLGSGALGSIKVSFNSEYDTYLDIRGDGGAIWTHVFTQINSRVHVHYTKQTENYHFHVQNRDMYAAELEAFAKCIREDTPPPVPGVEGLKNQLFLDTALEATSGPVEVPGLGLDEGK
ncbi:MAG: Gfo/Idh/MocA family protein [Promethearchaeota archaeon]